MSIATTSLSAHERLKGSLTLCSWRTGWRSLLLRGYVEPAEVDNLVTAPTTDQLVVLVTKGRCRIEGRYEGRWQESRYGRGDIGMTAPEEEVQLRWRDGADLETLQLHLPSSMLADIAHGDPGRELPIRLPNRLLWSDPTVGELMMSLARASQAGGSELYADAAAHFLAHHLLRFHSQEHLTRPVRREDKRMMLVDDLLRGSLSSKITLAELASVAGLSKFHLLRTFKLAFGETPSQRLTRYRMAEAKRLLAKTSLAVSEISLECGYDNPAHFAYAFRRAYGLSPREYRHKVQ